MQQKLSYAYIGLLALTLAVALLASFPINKAIVAIILLLSFVKFSAVGFQFMELKRAHPFWKILLSVYGGLLVLVVTVALLW